MKRIKSLFYMSTISSFLIMVFVGTVYGASVTMQREVALQNGQENAVVKNNALMGDNQRKFAPQRVKDKTDPGMESQPDRHTVTMERYKPYHQGEGERKIK